VRIHLLLRHSAFSRETKAAAFHLAGGGAPTAIVKVMGGFIQGLRGRSARERSGKHPESDREKVPWFSWRSRSLVRVKEKARRLPTLTLRVLVGGINKVLAIS